MIKNVLSGIGGVGTYGVIAITLFFAVFLGVLGWVLLLKRPDLERASRLPLESDEEDEAESMVSIGTEKKHE